MRDIRILLVVSCPMKGGDIEASGCFQCSHYQGGKGFSIICSYESLPPEEVNG